MAFSLKLGIGRGSQSENNYFTEMCSESKAGSYLRLTDFVCHSILGSRVLKEKKRPISSARMPLRDLSMRQGRG